MAIRLFFEYGNLLVQLPVNPEELTINSEGNNETINIVSLGDINILKQKKLMSTEIQCFFPATLNRYAPHVVTSGDFRNPQYYINFFERIRKEKKPVQFVVTDTKINMTVAIEAFNYSLVAGDEDINYTLELREYRPYSAKEVKIVTSLSGNTTPKAIVAEQRTPKKFAIGNQVTVNGDYWYTSYGDNPHGTFSNFKGKISHIVADKNRKYRYHITTLSGGYRGWVAENQLKH